MDKKQPAVYFIKHVKTDRLYVGSTSDLFRRRDEHETELIRGKHGNKHLQEAYNDDSRIRFMAQPTSTEEEAARFEQVILDQHQNTGLLFNVAKDVRAPGRGISFQHTAEAKEKISQSSKGRNAGVPKTAEHKEKISQATIGRSFSPEHVEKLRNAAFARAQKVSVDGVVYSSVLEVAKTLGLAECTVRARIANQTKFQDWFYV